MPDTTSEFAPRAFKLANGDTLDTPAVSRTANVLWRLP